MKVLVIYDSVYGNTEQIAKAIAGAVPDGAARVLKVTEASMADLAGLDVLIVGGPTQGGRATKAMQEFLDKIAANSLQNVRAAAFDTRLSTKWVGIFGYAAGKIAESLKDKGATLIAPPHPFHVTGTKGPLKEGEAEHAANWAKQTLEGMQWQKDR